MNQPIAIVQLFTYAGPNIFSPHSGVLLRAHGDRDWSQRLHNAIKRSGVFVGTVIGSINVTAHPLDHGWQIEVFFETPDQILAAEVCRLVIADIAAEARQDDDWNGDEAIFELQQRGRRARLPITTLQTIANARKHGLPTFVRSDDHVQIGYGVNGWHFPARPARDSKPPVPPWEQLGTIPIVAVCGYTGRAAALARHANRLSAIGYHPQVQDGAGFGVTRSLLADPDIDALVIGIDSADVLRHGIAFDRCDIAVITDMDGPMPAEAATPDEWLRALGIPMLLSDNPAEINLADPRLHGLLGYAPAGVVDLEHL
jgi:hypothetical protein